MNHYTNIAIDDYSYKFIFTDNPSEEGIRVVNLSDLIESLRNHYFITNGRLLANGLAQIFLMSDKKVWFDLSNTMIFGVFQILVFFISGINLKKIKVPIYLITLSLIWFLTPGPNHTLLWLDGSFNYLWMIVLVLCFLLLLRELSNNSYEINIWFYIPFFVFGAISGASHEVMSIGVLGALFFFYVFNFKKFKGGVVPLVLGFFLGTTFMILAPGNFVRLSSGSEGNGVVVLIVHSLYGFILSFKSLGALFLLCLILLVIRIKSRSSFSQVVKNNQILLLSILFSLAFIFLAGAFQPRVFFGIAVFSIIILLSFIREKTKWIDNKYFRIISILFSVFIALEFSYVINDLRFNKNVFDKDEVKWKTSNENVFQFRDKKMPICK